MSFAETINLPQPKTSGKMSLEEAIASRRSERSFQPTQLSKEQISQLLWACQGLTDPQWNFRSAPSSGSVYPLEIYIVDKNGVYHYLPAKNQLELILKGDKRPNLTRASLAQTHISEAPLDIVITVVFRRMSEKFGGRAQRYAILEAGHAAQNVLLQATAMGLGAVPVGSFWDNVVSSTLTLPPEHDPMYIIPVGYVSR